MKIKKELRGYIYIGIAIFLGMALVLFSSAEKSKSSNNYYDTYSEYEINLEKRIAKMISSLDGVGKDISVMVVSENDGEEIVGIAVICRADASARVEIKNMISTLTGLSTTKIFIGYKS